MSNPRCQASSNFEMSGTETRKKTFQPKKRSGGKNAGRIEINLNMASHIYCNSKWLVIVSTTH